MIPYVKIGQQIIKYSRLGFKKRKRELKHIYKSKQAKIKAGPLYGAGTTKVTHRGFKSPIIRTRLAKSNYSKLKWT